MGGWSYWVAETWSECRSARTKKGRGAWTRGVERSLAGMVLPPLRNSIAQIREVSGHARRRTRASEQRSAHPQNRSHKLWRGRHLFPQARTFDKGPTQSHFHLESGSRLSFGITLREDNGRCSLIAYRFQLNLQESQSPSYYRFDLNEKAHESPLLEPRCHYHAGVEDVRLPCPSSSPHSEFSTESSWSSSPGFWAPMAEPYSFLNAITGSTRIARNAGIRHAASAVAARTVPTRAYVTGS